MIDIELLKKLYKEYGEELLNNVTDVILTNGMGDCYNCRCGDYCPKESCFDAIKHVVKDILEEKINNGT